MAVGHPHLSLFRPEPASPRQSYRLLPRESLL